MKSKANYKSHPLHPILVTFPIAFFIGTFLFDCLGIIMQNAELATVAKYLNLAGVIGALIAAIPGLIDYIFTIPPKSSASKRGLKHGLINTSVLILFVLILFYRKSDEEMIAIRVIAEMIGIALLTFAGWMGGTLVHRNQIGVDIRYSGAGKWKEEYLHSINGSVKVAGTGELQLNQMKLVHVQNKRIVIGKTEYGYVAFDDHCPHRGGSLAGGALICGTVQCPWHGSQFDVGTGAVKAGPACENIHIYQVYEQGNEVFLELTNQS